MKNDKFHCPKLEKKNHTEEEAKLFFRYKLDLKQENK